VFGPKRQEVVGEDCIMRSFIMCTLTNYYQDDGIKEDEMGGHLAQHESNEKSIQNVGQKTQW
jgi:hypothetical protein